jgi:hypothetical protein
MSPVVIHIPGKPRIHSELKGTDVLWRYLDAAKFFDFIHHQTLFFCRGDQFEDKGVTIEVEDTRKVTEKFGSFVTACWPVGWW